MMSRPPPACLRQMRAPRMPLASLVTTQKGAPVAVDPSDCFELTMNELREVARFAAQGAQEVLGVFERADPEDRRPRTAIEAAWSSRTAHDGPGFSGRQPSTLTGPPRTRLLVG